MYAHLGLSLYSYNYNYSFFYLGEFINAIFTFKFIRDHFIFKSNIFGDHDEGSENKEKFGREKFMHALRHTLIHERERERMRGEILYLIWQTKLD